MPDLLRAILLGIIEGITEFLPISSTGHLILCETWMGLKTNEQFWNTFRVVIQFGAIAAVIVYFRGRIKQLLYGDVSGKATPLEISAAAAAGARASAGHGAAATSAKPGYVILMIIIASLPLAIAYFADE